MIKKMEERKKRNTHTYKMKSNKVKKKKGAEEEVENKTMMKLL